MSCELQRSRAAAKRCNESKYNYDKRNLRNIGSGAQSVDHNRGACDRAGNGPPLPGEGVHARACSHSPLDKAHLQLSLERLDLHAERGLNDRTR